MDNYIKPKSKIGDMTVSLNLDTTQFVRKLNEAMELLKEFQAKCEEVFEVDEELVNSSFGGFDTVVEPGTFEREINKSITIEDLCRSVWHGDISPERAKQLADYYNIGGSK